jgi:hypothetical protein
MGAVLMDNTTIRTATYLAVQERLDLKSKLKCNPPNRECGDRCIPPQWKCRVKGEGTDSHSRVVSGDPLAGAASIARGRNRLAKGLRTGNVVDIQAGRAAIARGVVKAVPGQNLKQKQELRKGVESAIIPIATGLFAAWALRQGHEGAKLLFPAYAKGPARNIEDAAGKAIGFVLDRVPIYGSYRQAQRENAALQAQVLGRAARIGISQNPDISANNQQRFIELGSQKIAGVRDAINKGMQVRESEDADPIDYKNFRSNLLSEVIGAKAKGQSIYAEPAAINLMAKQYNIDPNKLTGADNTTKKTFLISQISNKLTAAADSMRADMAVRGLDYKKPDDVDRYAETAIRSASKRFGSLTDDQRSEALNSMRGTVRELVSPSKSPQPTRNIATRLFAETSESLNTYFTEAAVRVKADTSPTLRVQVAASASSPIRSTLIGVAEKVKGRVGIKVPIAGANHAELVLQKVFHEAAVPKGGFNSRRKATWTASDTDIKYAAQDLGWDGAGGVSSAYGVLARSGQFPNLALRPRNTNEELAQTALRAIDPGMSTAEISLRIRASSPRDAAKPTTQSPPASAGRARPARRRQPSQAQRVAAYIKAGYSEETARRKAAEDAANLKSDASDDIPPRVLHYLKSKATWSL